MSGRLVGEVIAAVPELKRSGVTERGFCALVAIAEKCHPESRQGSVPWSWIQAGLYGASLSTAKRAVRNLKSAGAVRVLKRGFNNQAGRTCAPIYEVCALTERVTQMTHSVEGERVTQVNHSAPSERVTHGDPIAPDRTGQTGGRTGQIGDRTGHPGDLLNGSINGPTNGARARPEEPSPPEPPRYCNAHPHGTPEKCGRCAAAREAHDIWDAGQAKRNRLAAAARRQAIADCPLCDDDGARLGDDGLPSDHVVRCDHDVRVPQ